MTESRDLWKINTQASRISLILSPMAKVICDLAFLKERGSELSKFKKKSGNISIPGTVSCDSVFASSVSQSNDVFLYTYFENAIL